MAASGGTASERSRRLSMEAITEFRLVLVGKTGAGKSSSGNTILGRDAFRAAVRHASVTRECCKETGEVFGRTLAVVDTPGLFDTSLPERTIRREIFKCINMSAPGPHAILLVVKVGPFTAEERDAVRKVEEMFGEGAWRHTVVLFAQDEPESTDIDAQLREAGPELQEVLHKAGRRFHLLNNSRTSERSQVLDLLQKVERVVSENGGRCYSSELYREATRMLDQKESQLRELYEKKLEDGIRAVASKYEKLLREARQERQQLEERRQREVEELRRYYRLLERGARPLLEQTTSEDSMEDVVKYCNTLRLKLN